MVYLDDHPRPDTSGKGTPNLLASTASCFLTMKEDERNPHNYTYTGITGCQKARGITGCQKMMGIQRVGFPTFLGPCVLAICQKV